MTPEQNQVIDSHVDGILADYAGDDTLADLRVRLWVLVTLAMEYAKEEDRT